MNWYEKFVKFQYERIFETELDLDKTIGERMEEIDKLGVRISELRNQILTFKDDGKVEKPKPKSTGKINLIEANILLKSAFPKAEIFLSDPIYALTSVDEAKKFLKEDLLNFEKFKTNEFDCDNFSKALWGYWQDWQSSLALGILWITKPYAHALNVAILTDDKGITKVYCIEPQNDKMYEVPKNYVGRLIVM